MSKPQVVSSPRTAILDASVRLFGEHGYTGTTMRDIAKAVGVLPGSLYAHIDSKETLLLEIVESGIQRFLEVQDLIEASDAPADEKMRIAIKAHIGIVAENPGRTLVVFHQWRFLTEPNRTRAVEMRRRYAQTFMKILTDGIEQGIFRPDLDKRVVVFSVLGALNWTPEWYSPLGKMKAEEIGDRFADAMLLGLCMPGSAGRGTPKKAGTASKSTAKGAASTTRLRREKVS